MKRALAALGTVLTAVALTLTGCSGTTPVHGRVTGKTYQPAHTYTSTQTVYRRSCTSRTYRIGKKSHTSTSCRSVPSGTRPVFHHTAECWGLLLSNGQHLCVTSTKWHATRIGDHI